MTRETEERSRHLVDPELLPVLAMFPPLAASTDRLPAMRAALDAMVASLPRPEVPVNVSEIVVPAGGHGPAVRCLLLVPQALAAPAPAILHIHGGGYVAGSPEMSVPELMTLADALGCVILTVDYRLAPEAPAPAAVEDCHAALGWLHAEAMRLGIDAARIAIMGESAGGGLTAALAQLARDRGEHAIRFQLLDCPMLDDRTCLAPQSAYLGDYVWTAETNRFGWTCQLGHAPGAASVPPYAVPARAVTLVGLPPAFIAVGALDLLLAEDLAYAAALAAAGVPIELHVYPGCMHGFRVVPAAGVSQRARRHREEALRRAFT